MGSGPLDALAAYPLKIEEGRLVIAQVVRTVRNYCIAACLLDSEHLSKLLGGRQDQCSPQVRTRGTVVPNVVYRCGAILGGRTELLPYAVVDNCSAFGSLPIENLFACMTYIAAQNVGLDRGAATSPVTPATMIAAEIPACDTRSEVGQLRTC